MIIYLKTGILNNSGSILSNVCEDIKIYYVYCYSMANRLRPKLSMTAWSGWSASTWYGYLITNAEVTNCKQINAEV